MSSKSIEKISQSAANSLLKFMEEPLSHNVYGFLLTEN
jgi:DNA polymerase III subunit delta'